MAVVPSRSSVTPGRRRLRASRRPRSRRFVLAALVACCFCVAAVVCAGSAGAASPSPSASVAPVALKIGYTADADNLNPFVGYNAVAFET
jgi:hypothetical protein